MLAFNSVAKIDILSYNLLDLRNVKLQGNAQNRREINKTTSMFHSNQQAIEIWLLKYDPEAWIRIIEYWISDNLGTDQQTERENSSWKWIHGNIGSRKQNQIQKNEKRNKSKCKSVVEREFTVSEDDVIATLREDEELRDHGSVHAPWLQKLLFSTQWTTVFVEVNVYVVYIFLTGMGQGCVWSN